MALQVPLTFESCLLGVLWNIFGIDLWKLLDIISALDPLPSRITLETNQE